MYFEDIFSNLKEFWKDSFNLSGVYETETYIQELLVNYQKLEYDISFLHVEDFSEWERMLAFTMYQALTAYGIEKWKNDQSNILYFKEVPIETFEHYFKKNLEEKGNEEFLMNYRGFKSSIDPRVKD